MADSHPGKAAADLAKGPRPVRVGVGGWVYEPWRNNFFPEGLAHRLELHHASRQVSAIEINSTYYSTQKPATFAKWRDETPDGFVFSMKASRYTTNRRVLAEAGDSVTRFIGSGIAELGEKLGPIVWQFMPTKVFDAADFGAFLALLPGQVDGLPLRHAIDARHVSFMCAEYLALARQHGVATVFTDSDDYPSFADLTGPFAYARLMKSAADEPQGYAPAEVERWAKRAARWAQGGEPGDLPRVEPAKVEGAAEGGPAAAPRETFVFFINGAKERAPAAAMALLARLNPPA